MQKHRCTSTDACVLAYTLAAAGEQTAGQVLSRPREHSVLLRDGRTNQRGRSPEFEFSCGNFGAAELAKRARAGLGRTAQGNAEVRRSVRVREGYGNRNLSTAPGSLSHGRVGGAAMDHFPQPTNGPHATLHRVLGAVASGLKIRKRETTSLAANPLGHDALNDANPRCGWNDSLQLEACGRSSAP